MRKFTGEITTLKETFGFLRDDAGDNRYFHVSFVKVTSFDDLEIGDRVEFTPFVGPRGRRAEDIKVIARAGRGTTGLVRAVRHARTLGE